MREPASSRSAVDPVESSEGVDVHALGQMQPEQRTVAVGESLECVNDGLFNFTRVASPQVLELRIQFRAEYDVRAELRDFATAARSALDS